MTTGPAHRNAADTEVPVLVVGGGSCGLSASLFLSDAGIDHLLVERHPGTAHIPKAHYLNQRSMEVFRQHGVATTIQEHAAPVEKFGNVCWQTSLGGSGPLDGRLLYEMDAFGGGALTETYAAAGPVLPVNLPQIRLEPLMVRAARERNPGRVRFHHELVEFTDEGEYVTAVVENRDTGERYTVRSQYLIAADAGKTVGPALGVRLEGVRNLTGVATAHFSADLSPWVRDNTLITWLVRPEQSQLLKSALVPMGPTWGRHSEEWGLNLTFPPNEDVRFDADTVIPTIRDVLGLPDLDVELHHVSRWVLDAVLADRYRVGRVFLAGDAVHRHPPATGLGMNAAIQDSHNLVWKLAAVLQGNAGEALLDSYEAERKPVGRRNVDWAASTALHHQVITEAGLGLGAHLPPERYPATFHAYLEDSPMGETIRARADEIFRTNRSECQAHDIELGFAYDEGALVPDGGEPPPREPLGNVYHPTTRPGHRLPHAWLERTGHPGGRVSTHDLTGGDSSFLLLTGPGGESWREAADQVAEKFGVRLRTTSVACAGDAPGDGDWTDSEDTWQRVRGTGPGGAVLVRPDQHVAWRSQRAATSAASAVDALSGALRAVLAR